MRILVLNCGSSSLKFQMIETDAAKIASDSDEVLARGQVERLGGPAIIEVAFAGGHRVKRVEPVRDHRVAIESILSIVSTERRSQAAGDPKGKSGPSRGKGTGTEPTPGASKGLLLHDAGLDAIGHRVVHGGERFTTSVLIDREVLSGIADCQELAPLHNPANLLGIQAVTELFGDGMPQVAVFDTAFHTTLPEEAYLYALPYPFYRRHKIRRYGFHGTSHRYVSYRYRKLENIEPEDTHIISLHLGNGCSACAIRAGRSVDVSMGFTPLSGLVMGTRCGDIDPSLVEYLCQKEGLSLGEVDTLLNKQSGLLGLSGLTHDMRELLAEATENSDRRAKLAISVFCRAVRKQLGAYLAIVPECRGVIFTGGIGENAAEIRREILTGLDSLGLELDDHDRLPQKGALPGEQLVSRESSSRQVWVIPTNEELLIARDTFRCVANLPRRR